VLEAFDTLFNKRDYARAETFRRSTSGIARTSSQGAKDSEDRKLRDQAVNCVSQLRGIVEVRWCPFFRRGSPDSVRFVFRMNRVTCGGRIWDSTPRRSFSVSPFACCPSCCPLAREPRNVVRSYAGFSDAWEWSDHQCPIRLRAPG